MAAEYAGESPWIGLIESGLRRSPSFAPPHASEPGEHPPRATHVSDPRVHHGRIGSADRAVRDARLRDRLAAEHDLLALETDGRTIGDGGFADGIDRLVVRGVGGLAGEKIDHRWRPYAALVAAAYVRCLLRECPAVAPRAGP
jgi:nucleoside phosphorylase